MALLRPSELARVWELHPKTVYTWIREGKLPAIKTPGAQYRVRSDDARAYCEENALPLPRSLASPLGSVSILGKASPSQRLVAKACKARGSGVVTWPNALDGLLAVAADVCDVVAIDAEVTDVKLADALRALRKTGRTAGIPVVVFDAPLRSGTSLMKLGASTVVPRGKIEDAIRAIDDYLDSARERPR